MDHLSRLQSTLVVPGALARLSPLVASGGLLDDGDHAVTQYPNFVRDELNWLIWRELGL